MAPLAPHRHPRQAPGAAARRVGGETVVVTPADGHLHTLNEVGGFLFERADGSRSLEALAAEVSRAFEVAPQVAEADVAEFVVQAVALGILTWGEPQGGPGSASETG